MTQHYQPVSTTQLLEWLDNNACELIDTRSTEAYNGWQLRNEPRGGHIKGARTLPVKWATYIDWIEIVRHKQILPEDKIVLYGYEEDAMVQVARRFEEAGYKDINLYHHFLDQWVVNEKLPMEKMANYRNLVYPAWLSTLLSEGTPPHYENGENFVVCHAHYRNYDDYLQGHIPGAIALDTLTLESPETWNRRSPQELKAALEQHGITADTTVVLYGRFSFPNNDDPFPGSAAGHLGAIRCALIMMYAGVKDVRVLNGGIAAWESENLPLISEVTHPLPVKDFGAAIPVHPELIVDIEEAKAMIAASDADIVCTRSWPEYIGEVSGYNYIEQKGRIPGAVYVNNGSDAYHMENYQNLDYTTREFNEVVKMLNAEGVTPDKHLAFYCGTGWRGSEAFYNVWLLGWPRVSVFDGGWFEWSNDPKNPVESGIPT
ncbi:MAG: rhodanese-like domain-containing protein [bacterium]